MFATDENTSVIAVYFQYPHSYLYDKVRESVKEKLPFSYTLPCGNIFSANCLEDIPSLNTPCPCGNPRHWFVKYSIVPSLDRREAGAEH